MVVTPAGLLHDPEIILRYKSDPSMPLKYFEGKVGAVISDGEFFVTSPNMDIIYAPPKVSRISYKEDYRLGEHDASETVNVIGAFVNTLAECDAFFRAGIPVWLIRPTKYAGSVRVDSLVQVLDPKDHLCLYDVYSKFPVSFTGSPSDPQRFRGFAQYSRSFQLGAFVGIYWRSWPTHHFFLVPFLVLFNCDGTQMLYSISSSPKIRHLIQSRLHLGPRKSILLLTTKFLDQTPPNASSCAYMVYCTFARLFVGTTSEERQAIYFSDWLRYRSAFVYRIFFCSFSKPFSNQIWCTLLNLPLDRRQEILKKDGVDSGKNKNRKAHETVYELLDSCVNRDDEVTLNSTAMREVFWRGEKVQLGSVPPVAIAQEILWELCELNFRFELLALDRRANVPTTDTDDTPRGQLVLSCFPGQCSLAIVHVGSAREGLGAADWMARRSSVIAMRTVMQMWRGFLEDNVSSRQVKVPGAWTGIWREKAGRGNAMVSVSVVAVASGSVSEVLLLRPQRSKAYLIQKLYRIPILIRKGGFDPVCCTMLLEKIPCPSSLVRFLRRLFKMSSLLSGPGFFAPNQMSTTEPYLRALRAEYKTTAEMKAVRVTGVNMMKQPLGPSIAAHEYLVAILEDSNNRFGYLLVERMAGDHITLSSSDEHRSCSSSSPSSSSSSLISTSLDSISGEHHAHDEVTNLGEASVKQGGLRSLHDAFRQSLLIRKNCPGSSAAGIQADVPSSPYPFGSHVELPTNVDDKSIVAAVAKFTEELHSFEHSVEAVEAKARQQEDEIQVLKRELKEAREARA
ncbi:hypothetical protein BDZ97DRAFT_1752973 [Flammula alnicola]|nr:hypothetical protein BDZ97DRAFT_1752973 [Flammula alnicola]